MNCFYMVIYRICVAKSRLYICDFFYFFEILYRIVTLIICSVILCFPTVSRLLFFHRLLCSLSRTLFSFLCFILTKIVWTVFDIDETSFLFFRFYVDSIWSLGSRINLLIFFNLLIYYYNYHYYYLYFTPKTNWWLTLEIKWQ